MEHTKSKDNTWLLLLLAGVGVYWYMSKNKTQNAVPVTATTPVLDQPVQSTQPVYNAPVTEVPVQENTATDIIPVQQADGGSLIENLSSSQYSFIDTLGQNYVANPQVDQAQL